MFVLPPGNDDGTSPTTFVLLKPRLDGIASSTVAPLPKVRSDTRSLYWSNELRNALVASRTPAHFDPIELETSSRSDRSTMRRVASADALIVMSPTPPRAM